MARSRRTPTARMRQKSVPWESDCTLSGNQSSHEVLMAWLTMPSNAERWHREKRKRLMKEIIRFFKANDIHHRTIDDVQSKIMCIEDSVTSATEYLLQNGQLEAFQRGEAASEIVQDALSLCPQYRELQPIFGKIKADKTTQIKSKRFAHSAATEKGVKIAAGVPVAAVDGNSSAAGDWKKNLERMQIDNTKQGLQNTIMLQLAAAENENDDALPGDEYTRNESENFVKSNIEKASAITNEAEAQAAKAIEDVCLKVNDDSRRRVAKRCEVSFKTISHQIESDCSSSDGNKDENSESDEDIAEYEVVDEEELVQLDQRDVVNVLPADSDRVAADNGIDNHQSNFLVSSSSEADGTKSDGSEETDEEMEEESMQARSSTSAATARDGSPSESQGAKTEEKVLSTQLKSESERDEESEGGESNCENSSVDSEESAEELSEQSESSTETVPPCQTRKRSNSSEVDPLSRTKKASNKAFVDLERVAFLERVSQERDQREELFKLERAKLACELQSKQIQLSMERSLARKKLLSAGVAIHEVDRVLPL